ncbi:4Fe-4S dicluster domain-containing protein [Bernardetia sp. MNP-M8]|uniref:4Fe-4S dicluster domain-containing protein n=1 Tax=Bernardetia sp. MNP-M8 TaxID=3127470 RepID=UPI0030D47965
MALRITDACINCGACQIECPNNAIYEGSQNWSFAEGTDLKEVETEDGRVLDAHTEFPPLDDFIYYIVAEKCTECNGFHDEPQCAFVCPADCCVSDENFPETEEELLLKKAWLHKNR